MRRSIVLPAYNEEGSIIQMIEAVQREVQDWEDCEILVCDNASTDDTVALVRKTFNNDKRVKVVTSAVNGLYAWNVGRGLNESSGDRVFVLDADGQYPPAVLHSLDAKLALGDGLVLGYRTQRVGGFVRVVASYTYLLLCRVLLGFNLRDINSGAKAVQGDFARLFTVQFRGTMVNPELFAAAVSRGLVVSEVSVGHEHRVAGTTSHEFKKPLTLLRGAMKYFLFLRRTYSPLLRPRLTRSRRRPD